MSRIKISIHEIIEVEVESEDLPFSELKKETLKLFKLDMRRRYEQRSYSLLSL